MTQYTLDASAVIALLNKEVGNEKVGKILEKKPSPFMHAINALEVDYNLKKNYPQPTYKELKSIFRNFPITIAELINSDITDYAEYLKAKHRLSIADSIGLGLSRFLGTTFLTKDRHELEAVAATEDVTIEFLG